MKAEGLLPVGFGGTVAAARVVAIILPDSAPMKRLIHAARDSGKLVDATAGRGKKAVVVMDSGHVVLSALAAETLAARFAEGAAASDPREKMGG